MSISQQEESVAEGPSRAAAERLLAREEQWARRALPRMNVTWWNASLSGKAADYRRMEAAEKAINRHYARPEAYRRVARLRAADGLLPVTRRRLLRLEHAYRACQAPRELLDAITTKSAQVQEMYSTFRPTFEGQPVSDNMLEDILRDTTDSARARAAWEARKQIGSTAADSVRELARMRNEGARAVGFVDYWHQQMTLDELSPELMVRTLDAVHAATVKPFATMKADLDRRLAERFAIPVSQLQPWHYGDPFFQETPDVFAPSADPIYAERDVVQLATQTYRDLGFPNIDAILARSDLYPRDGKNQHAYAVDIDHEGDVRTFLNVQRNARWMGTLLHELGHTIYQDGIDRTSLPFDLRDDPQGFMNEGFAMFCEQPLFVPAWLASIAGIDDGESRELAPRLRAQDTANLLAFVRWCLTIVNFERLLYADPTQDLNTLWWDLVQRYQDVSRPAGRNAPDWASKIHVALVPVYYHKYLYGRLFSTQLAEKMAQDFGGWWQGHPATGAYIKRELFQPGATYPWTELVERVTGKPLGVDALGRAVAWPVQPS